MLRKEKYIEDFNFFKKKKKESFFKKFICHVNFSKLIKPTFVVIFCLIYFKIFGISETINMALYTSGICLGIKSALRMNGSHLLPDFSLRKMITESMLAGILLALPSWFHVTSGL